MIREFTITAPRGSGKTTFAAKQAINYAQEHAESRCLYVAPDWSEVEVGVAHAKRICLETCPFSFMMTHGNVIRFDNGSCIEFVNGRSNTHGREVDLLVFDEYEYIGHEYTTTKKTCAKPDSTIFYIGDG